MNVVQTVIDRQIGLYSRINYDLALRRLAVASAESYHGLAPGLATGLAMGLATSGDDPPVFACRFAEHSPHAHVLALANEDGRVAIQNTSVGHTGSSPQSFQCHNNAVFDLAWRPGFMEFVTVSGDHTASLWDLESGTPRGLRTFSSHSKSVKTVAFARARNDLFATGGRDGHVLLWDVRAPSPAATALCKPDNSLINCHSTFTPKTPGSHSKRARPDNHRATSITGLVFQDDQTLISCGEYDGNIKVWDIRKNYNIYKREPLPKHSIPYCGSSTKNGYTNLIIDNACRRLYASCMDNVIYCFNISTYNTLPEQRYIGHENSSFYIKTSLSPDSKYLVSGSSDKNAYIWNVKYSQPVVRLVGHWAEVTCAAWCQVGDTKIATCSDDARHKIWRIGKEYLDTDEERELKGRAELVPHTEIASLPLCSAAERTPRSGHKRARPHGTSVKGKSKRCLADLLGVSDTTPSKRCRLDSEQNNNRRCRLDSEPTRANPDFTYFTPKPSCSLLSPTKADWTAKTPVSLSRDIGTPVKVSPESPKVRIITIKTPTKNLPNYVLNGEAPHLRLMSPVKKRDTTADWLTQLRASRPLPAPLPAPAPAPPAPARPRPTNTKTLLKYFNIASKEK